MKPYSPSVWKKSSIHKSQEHKAHVESLKDALPTLCDGWTSEQANIVNRLNHGPCSLIDLIHYRALDYPLPPPLPPFELFTPTPLHQAFTEVIRLFFQSTLVWSTLDFLRQRLIAISLSCGRNFFVIQFFLLLLFFTFYSRTRPKGGIALLYK